MENSSGSGGSSGPSGFGGFGGAGGSDGADGAGVDRDDACGETWEAEDDGGALGVRHG